MTAPTLFDAGVADVVAENGGRVRRDSPETSKDAARKVKAGTQRARVLQVLASAPDGLNGWEAAVRAGITRPHAATTRLEELERLGFCTRSARTRPTDTGCQALLFFASAAGVQVAKELEG